MSLKKIFTMLRDKIVSFDSEVTDAPEHTFYSLEHKHDGYLDRIASENGVEYDADSSKISIDSEYGRLDTLEHVYNIVSEIYNCGDIMYDRYTRQWFFSLKK